MGPRCTPTAHRPTSPQTVVLAGGAEAAQKVQMFLASPQYPVCICSYEAVRKHAPAMAGKCHLLICDEGHRLKSASGKKTIRHGSSLPGCHSITAASLRNARLISAANPLPAAPCRASKPLVVSS